MTLPNGRSKKVFKEFVSLEAKRLLLTKRQALAYRAMLLRREMERVAKRWP